MSDEPEKQRKVRRRPDLDTMYTINTDGSRNFLHPADVKGPWQRLKRSIWLLLIAVYVAMPWLRMSGRPMIHLDLPGRSAQLFGQTFTNQDFYLVFFLVSGMGFLLFVLTSLLGRVWCGFACPQTVFMEGVVRRIERAIEGPRNRRIRRNLGPWTGAKILRKGATQLSILIVSTLIAHVFLSYFIPARELLTVVSSSPAAHKSAFFWSMFWTGVMYFNYAWFREQTCLIVCPYGRLQSTLIDDDTVIIGYDQRRGEPRAKGVEEGGDCIDCFRCVEVCPTGIDIRNGLQLECVGCSNCIDACNDIMARIDKPGGLVRYDSSRGFETGKRRLLRPRVFIYLIMGIAGLIMFGIRTGQREPFHANALRARGMPYVLEETSIRNLYSLHVQNKTAAAATYRIEPHPETLAAHPRLTFIIAQPQLRLEALDDGEAPIFATLPRDDYEASFDFDFLVTEVATNITRRITVRFRGP